MPVFSVAISVAITVTLGCAIYRFLNYTKTTSPIILTSYTDPFTLKQVLFSKTNKVSLSVIIPAFNESTRLPKMLQETTTYLTQRLLRDPLFTHELIIVDDGSTDMTSKIASEWAVDNHIKSMKLITLGENVGKGGAVTRGMLASVGERVMFCDADGASQFSDVEKLEVELDRVQVDGFAVATGCRSHLATDTVVKRSFIRNFLMNSFHAVIHVLGINGMKDTQCGFKMFTRKAADHIFRNMHVQGWIFDIEVILIARFLAIPVVEVDITWVEIPGSKMSLIKDAIRMLLDLVVIRFNYFVGIWSVKTDNI